MLSTTFVFLGFAHVWGASRKDNRVVRQFTAKERFARSLKAFNQQCRRMMHWPATVQYDRLCRMLKGHYGYFGISGNFRRLVRLHHEVRRMWRRWLSRRSSKSYLTWKRYGRVLQRWLCLFLGSSIDTPSREQSCTTTNRMRESRSCGSVRAEGSNVLGYSEVSVLSRIHLRAKNSTDFALIRLLPGQNPFPISRSFIPK
jgi:hypothetical protein